MASCLGGHFGLNQDYIPVADFYADKSIFVTGGTGFMGKVSEMFLDRHFYDCHMLNPAVCDSWSIICIGSMERRSILV